MLPVACSNFAFMLSRSLTMRVTSTSKMPCTCALVRFDMTMCSAIFLRMVVMGTTSPGVTPPIGCSGAVTAGMAGAAAGAEQRGAAETLQAATEPPRQERSAPCLAMNDSMSSFVMRPPRPVPETLRQVDVVLFGDAAHQWAGAHPVLIATFGDLLDRALLLPLQTFFLVLGKIGRNILRCLRSFRAVRLRAVLGCRSPAAQAWPAAQPAPARRQLRLLRR